MNLSRLLVTALLLLFAAMESAHAEPLTQTPWTIETSIEATYFVDVDDGIAGVSGRAIWTEEPANPFLVSPDGSRFVIVTSRGNLACDCNIFRFEVFDLAAVEEALATERRPRPARTFELASNSGQIPPMTNLRWATDGMSLIVQGASSTNARHVQLYRLQLETGEVKSVSGAHESIYYFDDQHGRTAYFSLERGPVEDAAYPVVAVNTANYLDLLARRDGARSFGLYLSETDAPRRIAVTGIPMALALAPGGERALAVSADTGPRPLAWRNYENPSISTRFFLLDVATGQYRTVFDAPTGVATLMGSQSEILPAAYWYSDGRHAILVNAALPLSRRNNERRRTAYLVGYDAVAGTWIALEPLVQGGVRVTSVSWLVENERLLVTHATIDGQARPSTVYSVVDGNWNAESMEATPGLVRPGPPASSHALTTIGNAITLLVRESPNQPPVAIATRDGVEISLTNPDPILAGVRIATSSTVQWSEPDGSIGRGLLTLPVGAGSASPPPLVIQAYHYMPEVFRPDGPYSSGYAAQALASQGFAVLGLDLAPTGAEEGATFVERVDRAVQSLADRQLIDPSRVGLIGFSRGGFQTIYAITHPGRIHITAAISLDGYTGAFSGHTQGGAINYVEPEHAFGGTFWHAKQRWLAESPLFNVDRVQTPFLMSVNGHPFTSAAVYEPIGAFRFNRRPFDLMLFPNGAHNLLRPRERYEALAATVDWMTFWIFRRENPNASRADRNARWRRLKEDWARQQAWESAGNPIGSVPVTSSVGPQHR